MKELMEQGWVGTLLQEYRTPSLSNTNNYKLNEEMMLKMIGTMNILNAIVLLGDVATRNKEKNNWELMKSYILQLLQNLRYKSYHVNECAWSQTWK